MAIYTTAPIKGADNQVFEFSDILSLPVDRSTYSKAHVGDIVKVGSIVGILMSEVAPTEAEIASWSASQSVVQVYGKPTYGLNKAGYASVRVKGGVFKFDVNHTGAKPVGTLVYSIAGTGGAARSLTTDGTKAGAEVFGWLYNAAPSAGTTANLPVVFDPHAAPVAGA